MLNLVPGSFVLHAKLQELGSGEVVSVDKGTLRVRFSSSERTFDLATVTPHLTVTAEGPAPTPTATRARKTKAKSKS
jgi:hypothetical protein